MEDDNECMIDKVSIFIANNKLGNENFDINNKSS